MNSNDVPIIGDNSINPTADDPPMRIVQKAFLVYQEADGHWFASSDVTTPTETFMQITAEDVMHGCQRVRDRLRDEEGAAFQAHMNMQLAQKMQEQAENAALINSLKF